MSEVDAVNTSNAVNEENAQVCQIENPFYEIFLETICAMCT